ncbi:helix-turn-helix transcriptional regulator [Flavobacteriaceae bacterium TP-CH-4]|uniref:Helix-turn-helix transcriptional regulator n=1 Tax=Pelagihabitans pacificus TaxID=2696054 RepID=A0A967AV75_9FLAO|nr:helix-turn-helix transcriptional regulator [Pelagihabitans pacificus]NHF58197.1 helix-turn-helix transcriptional regulator [Pelagihabitans pacificus]
MLDLTYFIVFVFSIAIAFASIWFGHQFTTTYYTKFHKDYFYYLITFFGFSFYGIWAQIFMRSFLSSKDTGGEMIEMVANFLPILGVPFLIISWIMLVKMGYSLVEVKPKKKFWLIHFIILAIIIALGGLLVTLDTSYWGLGNQLIDIQIGLVLFLDTVPIVFFVSMVVYHSKKYRMSYRNIITRFALLVLLGLTLRCVVLIFHDTDPWIFAPLLLLYFLSNFVPLFYLRLTSDAVFSPVRVEYLNEEKRALLFQKYQITKREKEIIDQICQGKTNQQIADDLFISLQTVKDHTHRIYTKIGINSRLKLVQMING